MGLDISHYKAMLQQPDTTDPNKLYPIIEDHYEGFNVPFSHFEKYIQHVDCPKILKTAVIVTEEKYLEYTTNWFKKKDDRIILGLTKSALKKNIQAYEVQNNLTQAQKHFSDFPQYWDLYYYYEFEKKTGFYKEQVGYQRKGMNSDFSYFYEDDIYCFALREDFERAYQCVGYEWEPDDDENAILRKKNYKENFLDKFELGASYMYLSY